MFISILSHILLVRRRRHNSFSCSKFFISVFLLCLQCVVNSPPLYLPAPEFPLIEGETVSAQILSEMNLGFMKRKASYKKKSHRPREISYRTMDLVRFCSSHYPVSGHRDSDGGGGGGELYVSGQSQQTFVCQIQQLEKA